MCGLEHGPKWPTKGATMSKFAAREPRRPARKSDVNVYLDCTNHNACPCGRAPTTDCRRLDRTRARTTTTCAASWGYSKPVVGKSDLHTTECVNAAKLTLGQNGVVTAEKHGSDHHKNLSLDSRSTSAMNMPNMHVSGTRMALSTPSAFACTRLTV